MEIALTLAMFAIMMFAPLFGPFRLPSRRNNRLHHPLPGVPAAKAATLKVDTPNDGGIAAPTIEQPRVQPSPVVEDLVAADRVAADLERTVTSELVDAR